MSQQGSPWATARLRPRAAQACAPAAQQGAVSATGSKIWSACRCLHVDGLWSSCPTASMRGCCPCMRSHLPQIRARSWRKQTTHQHASCDQTSPETMRWPPVKISAAASQEPSMALKKTMPAALWTARRLKPRRGGSTRTAKPAAPSGRGGRRRAGRWQAARPLRRKCSITERHTARSIKGAFKLAPSGRGGRRRAGHWPAGRPCVPGS